MLSLAMLYLFDLVFVFPTAIRLSYPLPFVSVYLRVSLTLSAFASHFA